NRGLFLKFVFFLRNFHLTYLPLYAGIKEAKIRLECVLEHALELGDKNAQPGCDFLIGRVVQYHIEEEIYEDGRINPRGLGAVSRLAGNDYAKIGEIFTKERPK
ncbi:hypothetical protein WMO63_17550, partial [Niallia sp. CLA-SR-H024]